MISEYSNDSSEKTPPKKIISKYKQLTQQQELLCFRIKNLDNQHYAQPAQYSTIESIGPLHKESIWENYRKQNEKLSEVFFRAVKKQNFYQLIQLFKKHAVDINLYVYMDGWTLLHYACNQNSKSIVQILINNGAKIEAITAMKRRPLHISILKNNINIVEVLLKQNADINCVDQDLFTPLHYAVIFGYIDIVNLLINSKQKIDITIKNNQQMTAIECCKDQNILKLLLDKFQIINSENSHFSSKTNNLHQDDILTTHTRNDFVDRFLDNRNIKQTQLRNCTSNKRLHSMIGSKLKGSQWKKVQKIVNQSICNLHQSLYESNTQSLSDYDKVKKLGQGSFGKVFLVRKKKSSNKFALKCLLKRQILKNDLKKYVYMERKVLMSMKNPFIVHAHSFFQDSQNLYIVMEACLGGDLQKFLQKQGNIQQKVVKMYAAQVVIALGFLHKQNILFRDLKSANVLIDNQGHLKIVDFGLAKQALTSFSFLGSYAYLAPQMLTQNGDKEHGVTIDWYLLGVLIYELLTSMPPFYHHNQAIFFKNIRQKKPQLPKNISNECKDILLRLLQKKPQNRLGYKKDMEQIKEHPWFKDLDWKKAENKQLPIPIPKIDHSQFKGKMKFDDQQVYWQDQNDVHHFSGWNYYQNPSSSHNNNVTL